MFVYFISYLFNVIDTEVSYIRLCHRLRDRQAQSRCFDCRELFDTFMSDRLALADGLPFTVYFGFHFIPADTFSISDILLDNAMVDCLWFVQFQCQAFLFVPMQRQWERRNGG